MVDALAHHSSLAPIEIPNLWHDEKQALIDLFFELISGEIMAFVGASSCGKSTALNGIKALCPHAPKQKRGILTKKKHGNRLLTLTALGWCCGTGWGADDRPRRSRTRGPVCIGEGPTDAGRRVRTLRFLLG